PADPAGEDGLGGAARRRCRARAEQSDRLRVFERRHARRLRQAAARDPRGVPRGAARRDRARARRRAVAAAQDRLRAQIHRLDDRGHSRGRRARPQDCPRSARVRADRHGCLAGGRSARGARVEPDPRQPPPQGAHYRAPSIRCAAAGRMCAVTDRPGVPQSSRERGAGDQRIGRDHDRHARGGRRRLRRRERHRAGHRPRRDRSDRRSVLHPEARRRRDGARALDQLRNRQEARRRDSGGQSGRRRGQLHRSAAPRAAARMTLAMPASEPATILLVDDEPRVLDSLEAMLGMDYRILRTERPAIALELLARERVAVVISDQRMPGMLGTELLSQSLEVSPETVRILLTAFTDAEALMASINAANIYHFVLKPWDPKELHHIVGQGVQRYRLAEEREQLVRDLARQDADLEATLAELRAAQDHVVREASLRTHLQRYVSPRLVDMAVANPTLLEIPGEWRQATVLFADIRGFTRLIETTRAPVMIRLLDEYFNRMIDVIFG